MSDEGARRLTDEREILAPATGRSGVAWDHARVDGHQVSYAMAGSGPAALFLHGWGLRPNAYRRTIEAMGRAGCRVYAPALPGFGGTPELAPTRRTFEGYAAWVGEFLDAVGQAEVALVAGHSFGGGVATAFGYQQSRRVSALLLTNTIGSPTWALFPDEVRTMVQRPVWDWGRHFSTDLLQSPGVFRLLTTLLEDFIPNLLSNPLGMFRTGEFIRRADLVREVRAIAERGIPVTVVWSDRDRLVPRSAFDELRRAAGVEGVVVEGAHAWLIADPARFGELAISALVDSGALTRRSVTSTA
ncbi:MAG: alpha/beta fold hydrolase [Acidimicrobiales bacterium]